MKKLNDFGLDWKGMRKDVTNYVKHCTTCQKGKHRRGTEKGPNGSLQATEAFRIVSMDFQGPNKIDIHGNQFVLAIIDHFTKYKELFAVRDITAETVARCLLQIYGRYGMIEEIRTDNGSTFTSKVIKLFMESVGSNHTFCTPHHHQGNGVAERVNLEFENHMRALIHDYGGDERWSEYLPIIQNILNNTESRVTGAKPVELLYGGMITSNRGTIFRKFKPSESTTANEYMQRLKDAQDKLNETSRRYIEEYRAEQAKNQHESARKYAEGEWILYREPNEKMGNKFAPIWKGPCEILSIRKNEFKVKNVLEKTERTLSREYILPYYYEEGISLEPVEALLKDKFQYFVEEVLEHRGKLTNDELEFFVKWKGYGSNSNSWISYDENKTLGKIKDYIRAKGLKIEKTEDKAKKRLKS